MSAKVSSSTEPRTCAARVRMAVTQISVPSPMVNANPCPSRVGSLVCRMTYAAE